MAPINIKPYRIPEQHKEEVQKQIDSMLEQMRIRDSPCAVHIRTYGSGGSAKMCPFQVVLVI